MVVMVCLLLMVFPILTLSLLRWLLFLESLMVRMVCFLDPPPRLSPCSYNSNCLPLALLVTMALFFLQIFPFLKPSLLLSCLSLVSLMAVTVCFLLMVFSLVFPILTLSLLRLLYSSWCL